ncbi:MAG: hypothetical protein LBD66_01680, partial [Holosporales bacterium]|nr:hypothetical protein [Holosporales bacterium]
MLTEAQRTLLRIYFREVLRKFFPEEVRPLRQEIMTFLKGLFQKQKPISSSSSCKKGEGFSLLLWPSWNDLLCLGKISVYYWRLRHLRSLDLSQAFTY